MSLKFHDKKIQNQNLRNYFNFFNNNYTEKINNISANFWQTDIFFKMISIYSFEDSLYKGEEYFVTKINFQGNYSFKVKISKDLVNYYLSHVLGPTNNTFKLESMTELESKIVLKFNHEIYSAFKDDFKNPEQYANQRCCGYDYNFVFTTINCNNQGKIIVSVPIEVCKVEGLEKNKTTIDLDYISYTGISTNICVGNTKIKIADINNIEIGDIILLENSDIEKMVLKTDGKEIPFKIYPEHSLIMDEKDNIDSNDNTNGDKEMNSNLWDNILVDVSAQFDNVKMPLGDVKKIIEGEVIDIASIYKNKIYLSIENKVIASGELIIINDRYGVQINEIIAPKVNNSPDQINVNEKNTQQSSEEIKNEEETKNILPNESNDSEVSENEENNNEDFSDFDIDDESI